MDLNHLMSNEDTDQNVRLATPPKVLTQEETKQLTQADDRVDTELTPLNLQRPEDGLDGAVSCAGEAPLIPAQLPSNYPCGSPTDENDYTQDMQQSPLFQQLDHGRFLEQKLVSVTQSKDGQEISTREGNSLAQSGQFQSHMHTQVASPGYRIQATSQNTDQLQYYADGSPINTQAMEAGGKKSMTGFGVRSTFYSGAGTGGPTGWITPAQRKLIQKQQKMQKANMTQREVDYQHKRKKVDRKRLSNQGGFRTYYANAEYQGHTQATSLPDSGAAFEAKSQSLSREGHQIKDYLNHNVFPENASRLAQGVGTAPSGQKRTHDYKPSQRLKPKWVSQFGSGNDYTKFQQVYHALTSSNPSPSNANADQRNPKTSQHQRGVKIENFLKMRSMETSQQNYGMPSQMFDNHSPPQEQVLSSDYQAQLSFDQHQELQDRLNADANYNGTAFQRINRDGQQAPLTGHDLPQIALHHRTSHGGNKLSTNLHTSETTEPSPRSLGLIGGQRTRLQSEAGYRSKFTSSQLEKATHARNSLKNDHRQTFFFADQNDASFMRRQIKRDQLNQRRKDMQAFMQAQADRHFGTSGHQSTANADEPRVLSENDSLQVQAQHHSKRMSEQFLPGKPYEQLSFDDQQLCRVINEFKLNQNSTDQKKGLSMYYQDTLANMFAIDSTHKRKKEELQVDYGTQKHPGLISAINAHVPGAEYFKAESDRLNKPYVKDQAVRQFKNELQMLSGGTDRSQQVPAFKQLDKSQDEFFKREFKNPQHFNITGYERENMKYREIYKQSKKNQQQERANRQYLHKKANGREGSSMTSPQKSRQHSPAAVVETGELLIPDDKPPKDYSCTNDSVEHLVTPEQYLDQKFGYLDLSNEAPSTTQHSAAEESHKATEPELKKEAFQKMFDEHNGLIVNKVSTAMIDLEDMVYNKQFNGGLEPKKLEKLFQKLRNEATSKKVPKPETLARSSRMKQHAPNSLTENSISIQDQAEDTKFANLYKPFQLEYRVKHNIKLDPKSKKRGLLDVLGIKQTNPYEDKSRLESFRQNSLAQTLNMKSLCKRRRRHPSTDSEASEEERRRRADLGWKTENDQLFAVDKYLFKVKTKKRTKKPEHGGCSDHGESESSSDSYQDPDQVELKTFLTRIDDRIQSKAHEPDFDGTISGHYIKQKAKELYKMIKGEDVVDENDGRYKKYLLDVFANFPENPLMNTDVSCVLKPIVSYVQKNLLEHGHGQQQNKSKSAFDVSKDKETRPDCTHAFSDDTQLKKCYNMQLWFLNFYKYICTVVLDKEIQEIDVNDEDHWARNREMVDVLKEQKGLITGSMKTQITKAKKSMKKMAADYILKNLVRYVQSLSKEEQTVFKDALKVKELLHNPVLKLIPIEHPQALLDYKVDRTSDGIDSGMIDFDNNKELFINALTTKVLKSFKKELIQVQMKRYVTFKNVTNANEGVFDYYEEMDILDHLKAAGISLTDSKNVVIAGNEDPYPVPAVKRLQTSQGVDQVKDNMATLDSQNPLQTPRVHSPKECGTPVIELDQQLNVEMQLDKIEKNRDLDEWGFGPGSKLPVTKIDLIRAAVGNVSKKCNLEIIKKYEQDISKAMSNRIKTQFAEFKQKLSKKSSIVVLDNVDDPAMIKIPVGKLSDSMPVQMKINIYQSMKTQFDRIALELHRDAGVKADFYLKAKEYAGVNQNIKPVQASQVNREQIQEEPYLDRPKEFSVQLHSNLKLSAQCKAYAGEEDSLEKSDEEGPANIEAICKAKNILEDTAHDEMIEYFEICRKDHGATIPFFFKNLRNNTLYFKQAQLTLSHAEAMKNVLIEASKVDIYPQYLDQNPFLIKTLIIDDCQMSDEIFEQILLGVEKQQFIRSIHYVNGNTLGPKSTAQLKIICARQPQSIYLQELNLSNIKVLKNFIPDPDKDGRIVSYVAQISQKVEDVMKLNRLRLSNMDLDDRDLTQNLLDILQSNFNLTYINLSYGKIELGEFLRISREFKISCGQVQYLSIGGNPLTKAFRIPWDDPQIQTGPKQLAPARPDARKMEDIRDQMVDEVIQNICAFIELPQSQLRFLDISEMGMETKHLRRILCSMQKNTTLESINLGNIYSDKDFQAMQSILKLRRREVKINSNFLNSEKDVTVRDHYMNTGLLRHYKQQKEQRESMLMMQDSGRYVNPMNRIIVNRTTRNPELFFNPFDPEKMFDANLDQQWKLVKNCHYCTGYRYSLVYFNVSSHVKNTFKFLPDQDEMMALIDEKYPKHHNFAGVQPPLLIVDGNVYEMVNPIVYACFLQIREILDSIDSSANHGSYGATDLTGINLYQSNVPNQVKQQQQDINNYLKQMTEQNLREMLITLCNEVVTPWDLEELNEHQLKVLSEFYQTNWEYMIDKQLMENNGYNISQINEQHFEIDKRTLHQIEEVKDVKKRKQNRETTIGSQISKDKLNGESISKFGDSSLESAQSNTRSHLLITPVYMFAGYLPPGKQTIYIYDREHQEILYKECIIDIASKDGQMQGASFKYQPVELTQEQKDFIDESNAVHDARTVTPLTNGPATIASQL